MKTVSRIINLVIYGITILVTIIMFGIYFSSTEPAVKLGTSTDVGFFLTYGLGIVAIIALIASVIMDMLSNPKGLQGSAISAGVLLVLALISYFSSGAEVTPLYQKFGVDASLSQLLGGGLVMSYILTLGSIAILVVSEVISSFNNR